MMNARFDRPIGSRLLLWGAALVVATGVVAAYATGLDRIPPNLGHDEALFGLNARSIADYGTAADGTRFPFFFSDRALGPHGRAPLSIYASAAVFKLGPDDELAVRRASVIAGLVSVAIMFFLASQFFGSRAWAAVAALLLAATPAHFFYSRVGVEVVYLLPFVLGWMLFLLRWRADPSGGQWNPALAGLCLGMSLLAYKSAQVLGPAFLALTVSLALRPPRRDWRGLASMMLGLGAGAVPFVTASIVHRERFSSLIQAYGIGSPDLSMLQNIRSLLTYGSIGDRVSAYVESFSPRILFFFADGGWVDSTRLAGVFLLPAAIPLIAGLYRSLGPDRSEPRLVAAIGFLLSPLPAMLTNEITSRRMITIVIFGVLLTVEGLRWMSRLGRSTRALAWACALAMAVHANAYYDDYVHRYPARSHHAWELNIGDAMRQLGDADRRRGHADQIVVAMGNQFAEDYAALYLGRGPDAAILKRMRYEYPRLAADSALERTGLLLLQIQSGATPDATCRQPGDWQLSAVVTEVNGSPSFVVCERR
jgi:hypothetical protein